MYNGIGLTTPRGSGTNGYIQTNKFFVRARPLKSEPRELGEGQGQGGVSRKANREILEHDRKRQIELKLTELEDELLEQGALDLEEIATRVETARKELEAASNEGEVDVSDDVRVTATQTHQVAAKKEKQLDIMKMALGLEEIKEGEAFDRELQEQRKQERIMEREEKERERKEKQMEAEKEEKRREKEQRNKEKEEAREKRREEKTRRKAEEEAALRKAEEAREKRREEKTRRKEGEEAASRKAEEARETRREEKRREEKRREEKRREEKTRRNEEEEADFQQAEEERKATKRRRRDR